MSARKRSFDREGRRCLVFRWTSAADRTQHAASDGKPATVGHICRDGSALVFFDDPRQCSGYALPKDVAFRFRDPQSPTIKRKRAGHERAKAKAIDGRKENRVQVNFTDAELRAVLRLAKRYTELDRNAGKHNPGVTATEAVRRAALMAAQLVEISERPESRTG
jgi:hypothetical protein